MKNIIIAVTGSISAFKTADICSKLKKYNYNITVIMTKNATKFITPLTFQTLTSNKVYIDLFEDENININHIELLKKCDLFLVCPATANILAKVSNGIADDFVSTTLMAMEPSKVFFAPAMNMRMYSNPINLTNVEKLKKYSYNFIEPDIGLLACGDIGIGKLASVDKICEIIHYNLEKTNKLKDKNILITAGSSFENIDPIRKITNNSSGKMGYALAKAAIYNGANVHLISSKTNLKAPENLKTFKLVNTYDDFFDEITKIKDKMDVIIMSAAISDFKVKNIFKNKIKKDDIKNLKFEFEINKDILKYLSQTNNNNYKLVGFSAETENHLENSIKKLMNKNLDYIIVNDVSNNTIGFFSENNEVTIIDKDLKISKIDFDTKENIAKKIFDVLEI